MGSTIHWVLMIVSNVHWSLLIVSYFHWVLHVVSYFHQELLTVNNVQRVVFQWILLRMGKWHQVLFVLCILRVLLLLSIILKSTTHGEHFFWVLLMVSNVLWVLLIMSNVHWCHKLHGLTNLVLKVPAGRILDLSVECFGSIWFFFLTNSLTTIYVICLWSPSLTAEIWPIML